MLQCERKFPTINFDSLLRFFYIVKSKVSSWRAHSWSHGHSGWHFGNRSQKTRVFYKQEFERHLEEGFWIDSEVGFDLRLASQVWNTHCVCLCVILFRSVSHTRTYAQTPPALPHKHLPSNCYFLQSNWQKLTYQK